MLHAGLDLSRRKLDVCLLSDQGELLDEFPAPPDAGGLRALTRRVDQYAEPVCAVIESMTGARFIHDTLEAAGWDVEIADAQKVKGLAPLAARPTASTPACSPCSPSAIWCRRSGCPTRGSEESESWRASACT
jgi:transposase